MLDIKKIHKNPEWFKEKLALRDIDSDIIDRLLQVDDNRKQCIQKIDDLKFKRRNLEKKFVQDNSGQSLEVLKEVKRAIDILEKDLDKYTKEFDDLMYSLPNVPLADVPEGEKDKIIVEKGKKPLFTFIPKDYLSISEQLDLINIEDASNVSGSRFSFIKNELVFLQFALIKYVYDKFCQKYNFIPILPPFFIKSEYFKAMGYIDIEADKNETYYLPDDDLYLIGTAEHILGAMNANKIFQEEQLPQRFLGFSSCFRREAGSYGKDTKGILRSHQFDKIEMLSICTESQSLKEQDLFIDLETKLIKDLVLPYRIVQTAVKNLSRPSARSFDIEC